MLSSLSSERLLLTLWVGGLWAIGYLAVPMAFVKLGDITLAGTYAGQLFTALYILGLGCGTVLILTKLLVHKLAVKTMWRFWVLVLMVIITAVFIFYIQPKMAEIKQMDWQVNSALSEVFSLLHKVSENLHLALSLLGLALVVSTDKQFQPIKAV
jgi:hypothetical protein